MPANTEHEAIKKRQPGRPEVMKIWRYLSLPKLISLLQTRTLHFAKLGELNDDLCEGTFPTVTQIATDLQGPSTYKGDIVDDITRFVRENTYVNCWSGNQKESAAMWRLYGTSPGSVAIQSTYGKLVRVLPDTCFVGMVRYLDYDIDRFPLNNVLYPGFHKRIEFEFEKEVRALKVATNSSDVKNPNVDLHELIERVYIRSTEEQWMIDVIKGVLDQHGLQATLTVSSLDSRPARIRIPKEIKEELQKERDSRQQPSEDG